MANGLFGTGLNAPKLRKVERKAAPVPTAVVERPQQIERGSNLQALAQSLGGLNSALLDYAKIKDKQTHDPDSRDNREWLARAQLMDQDQLAELAASGEADGIRVREDALDKLMGERAFSDFLPMAETHFSTEFDRATGDVDGEYERLRAEYAEALPNDMARAVFYNLTDKHKARTVGGVTEERIAATKQQVNSTIVDSWYYQITDAAKDGELDPEAVAEAIFGGSVDNGTFYELSQKEQDATVWALAQRLAADGKVDEAEALLDTPRKGPGGSDLPALSTIPEFAVKGRKLVETAKTERAKRRNEASAARRLELNRKVQDGSLTMEDFEDDEIGVLYTETQAASMVAQAEGRQKAMLAAAEKQRKAEITKVQLEAEAQRDRDAAHIRARELMAEPGGIHRLGDAEVRTNTGGTAKVSRAERIEAVRREQEVQWAELEERLVNTGVAPEAAADHVEDLRQGWYINQFLENPQWKREFASLPATITPAALERNPELAAKAAETAERYLAIKAKSPSYAETLVSPEAREFLEHYEISRTHDLPAGAMNPEDAVEASAAFTAMSPFEKARTSIPPTTKAQMVRRTVKASNKGSDGKRAVAKGASLQLIEDRIDRLASRGLDDKAIEADIKAWAEEHTITVNGVLVPIQSGMAPDFPDLIDRHLGQLFEGDEAFFKAQGINKVTELSIAPVHGESFWTVIHADTGLPIGMGNITQEELQKHREDVEAEAEENIRASLEAAENRSSAKLKKTMGYVHKLQQQIEEAEQDPSDFGQRRAADLKHRLMDYTIRTGIIQGPDADHVLNLSPFLRAAVESTGRTPDHYGLEDMDPEELRRFLDEND